MFAQVMPMAGLTFVQWIILAIILAGVIGIFLIVVRRSGIAIPDWIVQIFWIVLCVFVAIIAIKFLVSLW